MKKIRTISVVVSWLAVLFLVNIAHAELNLIGQGTSVHGTYNLIYDTDLDITWYDYTRGVDTWQNQVNWADALSVTFGSNTYTDWRLPVTVDGSSVTGYDGTTTSGYNITTSELGYLFYTSLGNEGRYDTLGNETGCYSYGTLSCLTNTDDFQNLQTYHYWSGTEYATSPGSAWHFYPNTGWQGTLSKINNNLNGIAVMDGIAVVLEPISSALFIVGGATLGLRRYLRRRKT